MAETIIPSTYLTRRVDEPDTATTYVGYSLRDAEEDSGTWIVKKITLSSTVTSIQYGRGSWTDRETLIYE